MGSRPGPFDRQDVRPRPRLDAWILQRPIRWLTPNRLVATCRLTLVVLLLLAMGFGPEGLGSTGPRFAVAYMATLVAMPAFPRIGGRDVAGAMALLLGARWTFSAPQAGTAEMLMTQLAGILCAVAPVYARNIGQLHGSVEGHISFTERHAMWRRSGRPMSPPPPGRPAPPAPAAPAAGVALLDYRPENR